MEHSEGGAGLSGFLGNTCERAATVKKLDKTRERPLRGPRLDGLVLVKVARLLVEDLGEAVGVIQEGDRADQTCGGYSGAREDMARKDE